MATPNPLSDTHSTTPPPISTKEIHIAGILALVHGLSELPHNATQVSVLWLLHPRLQTKEIMTPIASSVIHTYNATRPSSSTQGLIAVAFDQRNHGTREVAPLSNEAWKQGNPAHAQDMFSVFQGTAMDVGLLIDHLGSYVVEQDGKASLDRHFSLGISLGGHSSWQCFFNEPRIRASVVIIGCPDYMRVMKDRARLTKLQTYTKDNGATFLGSIDFPAALVATCLKHDPKGLLFGTRDIKPNPAPAEQAALRKILDARIRTKAVLICSGGDDKLVPYHATEKFADFLKTATQKGGWYEDGAVYVEDRVYAGVGHAMSEGMTRDSIRFLCNLMNGRNPGAKEGIANL